MPPEYKTLVWMAVLFLGFPVYFLPAFIAAKREHPKRRKLLLWNFLAGWTGIGWVLVLFSAVRGIAAEETRKKEE